VKIKSFTSIGMQQTFSPEMSSSHHNYILDSGAVHANSHGVSYAGVISFRSLFYKAHFFPEWISSVLNDCNVKKVPRYIAMARSEGWEPTNITNLGRQPAEQFRKFDIIALDINNIKPNYNAIGNVVSVGLLSVKGIGEADRGICDIQGPFESVDHYITMTGAGKKVMEPLIRLGAFDRIAGHANRKALWTYYMYVYKKFTTADRDAVAKDLLNKTGWTEDNILEERKRQVEVYSKLYPKKRRDLYPKKIINWRPEPKFVLEQFNSFIEDYKISERLKFEDLYLGYSLSNPLLAYDTIYNKDIPGCIKECEVQSFSILECIITEVDMAQTGNGSRYCRLVVSDGTFSTTIFIWDNILSKLPPTLLKKGRGVVIPVCYDKTRKSFTVAKGHSIVPLGKKD